MEEEELEGQRQKRKRKSKEELSKGSRDWLGHIREEMF